MCAEKIQEKSRNLKEIVETIEECIRLARLLGKDQLISQLEDALAEANDRLRELADPLQQQGLENH